MGIRPFRSEDAPALAALASGCARTETDFVLNPMWEITEEVEADFARQGIEPSDHLLVADDEDGVVLGMAGFLRRVNSDLAGLICPIVGRGQRGRGLGGQILRAALAHGQEALGIKVVTAGIGARNHAGYALLAGAGFRPMRQHVLMRCDERPKPAPAPVEGLVFEPAKPADADAIHTIYESCGFEPRTRAVMGAMLGRPGRAHCVARKEGSVVGFVELDTHWPHRPWVSYVGVEPGLRDRGVGSGLVGWALGREFDAGATAALLLLSPANRTALRAYEKVGFRRFRMVDVLEKRL